MYSDLVIDPIEKANNNRYDSIHIIINNFGQTPVYINGVSNSLRIVC